MRVELLVIEDCPHEAPAGALLRRALDDIGLATTSFNVIVVNSEPDADRLSFLGSPTFRADGRDLFSQPDRPPALACRMYGPGQALPGLHELRRALKETAATAI